ncbi:MAG: prepilin-type N-terminal cleavage/methylation domain-containing protein [bacterium]|nr:prepilin-type N-terminal cleavage/methylation domain-containing protein [bacterium]
MNSKDKTKSDAGLTIVELLVAVTLFSVVVAIVGNIFLVNFQSQRRSLAFQTIFDQTSFLMEYMSRSLRMAKRETTGCLSAPNLNYETTRSGKGIKFVNSDNVCQEFFLDVSTSRLKEKKDTQEQFLTSENSQAVAFGVGLSGQDQADDLQPRVTFSLTLKRKSAKPEMEPFLTVQTSLSQRRLDK